MVQNHFDEEQIEYPNIQLTHNIIVKSRGLYPMLYKVSEIASYLEIPYSTVKTWISKGAPAERSETNRIWVNGELFANWIEQIRLSKRERKINLLGNEGYCLTCKQAVKIMSPITTNQNGKLRVVKGSCPFCDSTICRGLGNDQKRQ